MRIRNATELSTFACLATQSTKRLNEFLMFDVLVLVAVKIQWSIVIFILLFLRRTYDIGSRCRASFSSIRHIIIRSHPWTLLHFDGTIVHPL